MSELQPIIQFLQHSSDDAVVEQFFEYESLIWIDWREDEEDLIQYFKPRMESACIPMSSSLD